MAASQDPNDNPVAINVVPMVDVIFCLCVFFMCSFKFKQLEGKFESWLPKNKGDGAPSASSTVIEEIRVALFWDAQSGKTVRQFGARKVQDDNELAVLIKEQHDAFVRQNKPETPVIIDAHAQCPWTDVINVMNLCKKVQIDKIEFAMGGPAKK